MSEIDLSPDAQHLLAAWSRDVSDLKEGIAKVNEFLGRLVSVEESRKYTEESLKNLWARHNTLEERVTLVDKTLTSSVTAVSERAGQGSKLWDWVMPAIFGLGGSLVGGLLLYLVSRA